MSLQFSPNIPKGFQMERSRGPEGSIDTARCESAITVLNDNFEYSVLNVFLFDLINTRSAIQQLNSFFSNP
jgi:hypothetical protein